MACYIWRNPDYTICFSYKIGKANDAEERLATAQTFKRNLITEYWFILPTDPSQYTAGMLFFIEKTIHKLLAKYRVRPNGEHFDIPNIEETLQRVLTHLSDLGLRVKLTRDINELAQLHDVSLDELPVSPTLQPTEHQIGILTALKTWHSSDQPAGKLILPPGIGKSYLVCFYLRELHETTRVLIIVPLKSIKADFSTVLKVCQVKASVSIYINNTVRKSTRLKSSTYDIIVYDEAHHICAPINKTLLNITSTKKLFLTATEKLYNDKKSFDMTAECFGPDIARMTIPQAIGRGLLADYKIFMADWQCDNNSHKPKWTIDKTHLLHSLTELYHRRRIIIFVNTVAGATTLNKTLIDLGYHSAVIHGGTAMKERADIIKSFSLYNGPSVICNVQCIGEGVNIPAVDCIVFINKRSSNIGIIQNIGRGLRRHPDKDFCMVVIHPDMANAKFIQNLIVHDERFKSPTSMIIAAKRLKQVRHYSVEHIAELVELYSTQQAKDCDVFCRKLTERKIYCEADYTECFKNNHTDEFPRWPTVTIAGFTWDKLTAYSATRYITDGYTLEQAEAAIISLLTDERLIKIKALHSSQKKIKYLSQLDEKINISLLDQLKQSQNPVIRKLFSNTTRR